MSQLRYAAGVVNHGAYDDLECCLESLARQTLPPTTVYVIDTGVDPARVDTMERRWPAVHFDRGPNRGYAGGANRFLSELARGQREVEFALVLNPDIVLDPPFAERLLGEIGEQPRVALASGKLLRAGRTHIDSAGIVLPRHRRPRDRGSEEEDRGQFERVESIFGASGAALMIRRSALPTLAIDGEVFDEDFFAYFEDTDLAWRAHRLGFEVLYVPTAVAVHARGWKRSERMNVAPRVRQHSFANHYLQLAKNERLPDLLRNLPTLLVWEVLRLGFALLQDRAILGGYALALRRLPRALRKRRRIQTVASDGDPARGAIRTHSAPTTSRQSPGPASGPVLDVENRWPNRSTP